MTSFRAKSSLLLVLIAVCALPLLAQAPTARVEGNVSDGTGAVLPGATVTATNIGTNGVRIDVTNEKGAYSIPALPVGNYRVQVELSGFKPEVTPIVLTVGQVARLDFKMQLGGATEEITVTASAPLIEKSTSEISTLIDQKQIENLPLNGRNFTQLATLAPGVNRGIPGSNSAGGGSGTDAETFRYSEFGGAALSVNGLREQFNNFQIEGVDNNETLVNSIAYLPPPEAIREFSVITTNAPAEYGRAAAGPAPRRRSSPAVRLGPGAAPMARRWRYQPSSRFPRSSCAWRRPSPRSPPPRRAARRRAVIPARSSATRCAASRTRFRR